MKNSAPNIGRLIDCYVNREYPSQNTARDLYDPSHNVAFYVPALSEHERLGADWPYHSSVNVNWCVRVKAAHDGKSRSKA
jgi:hypothetical protein